MCLLAHTSESSLTRMLPCGMMSPLTDGQYCAHLSTTCRSGAQHFQVIDRRALQGRRAP